MTVIRLNGQGDRDRDKDRDILDIAETEVGDLLSDLSDLRAEMRDTPEAMRGAEFKKTLTEVRTVIRIVLTERSKLDEARKRETGAAGSFAMDLDAARDEIRDRLDRLRAARDAEGLSE